jgi:hypothetical protein
MKRVSGNIEVVKQVKALKAAGAIASGGGVAACERLGSGSFPGEPADGSHSPGEDWTADVGGD